MSADVTVANARTRTEVGQSLLQAISRGEAWSPAYHAAWLQKRAPRILSIDAAELLELLIDATSESSGGIPRGLSAEGLRVNGLLDLRRLNFPKSIMLRDCRIKDGIAIDDARLGPLDLSGSDFPHLSAEGVHVDGDLILDRLEHTDWISLCLARIAGQLNLAGSHLNPRKKNLQKGNFHKGFRARVDQTLHCYNAEIKAGVWLSDGFSAYGEVSFIGATIGKGLICADASFINPNGCALYCAGSRIGETVVLISTTAHGEVNFNAATIGGNLTCTGASLTADPGVLHPYAGNYSALNLLAARIMGQLVITQPKSPISSLCLRSAQVGALCDDPTAWPEKGKLELDGFVYGSLGGFASFGIQSALAPLDYESRLDWLQRQVAADLEENFKPQPWTQCAKVLAALGRTHDARLILYERERHWLKSKQQHPVTRFFYRFLLGPLSGYGYKNHYALGWALGIWLFGAVIFGMADHLGMMRPASEHVVLEQEYQRTGHPPPDYEPLNPLFYSADLLLPIVDIGQERYWIPRNGGEKQPDSAAAFPSAPARIARALTWLFSGWLPKAYYYFEIAMGWLLVSIVLAGFSKFLGHAKED
jgi:hypothetical protein